ncbi:hypothetical protein [Paenarthrobacter sp. NPDC090522]|uniref:hypothetical protein n=1 Tax=Paenarthrobacter sp. NPDC090522 TaxID=3364383 RepID=UPI0037FABAB1
MQNALNIKPIPFETSTPVYYQWHFEELKLRGFLLTSNIGMNSWFEDQYDSANTRANTIFDPDRHGLSLPYDIFMERTGIDPNEYWWQLSAAAVKDACGLLEVFLEEAAHEVLGSRGSGLLKMRTEESWHWNACAGFYEDYLGLQVKPAEIADVIWMRNKLTHLRDELRTREGLNEFHERSERLGISHSPTPEELALGLVPHEPYAVRGVHLTQIQTWRVLEIVRSHVDALGLALHGFVYGSLTSEPLEAVAAGTPVDTPNFKSRDIQRRD